jgi:hypothetical protein
MSSIQEQPDYQRLAAQTHREMWRFSLPLHPALLLNVLVEPWLSKEF